MRILVLAFAFLLAVAIGIPANDAPNFDTVMAAWKNRQDKAETFRFRIERTYKRAKQTMRNRERSYSTSEFDVGTSQFYVEVKPKGFYIEYDTIQYEDDVLVRYQEKLSETNNLRTVQSTREDKSAPTEGYLQPIGEGVTDAKLPELTPLMHTLRGVNKNYATLFLPDYKQSGQKLERQGLLCECFVPVRTIPRFKREAWLAPSQDWLPVQIEIDYGSSRTSTIIINAPHAVLGWCPASWKTISHRENGIFFAASDYKVLQLDINPAMPEAVTPIVFPPGTKVGDDRGSGTRTLVANEKSRLIDPTTQKDATPLPEETSSPWLMWSFAIAALGAFSSVAYFRWFRK